GIRVFHVTGVQTCALPIFKTQVGNGSGALNDPRIVIMHTIDIGPYLYFVCTDGSTDERRRIITPSSSEVIDFAESIPTDISLCDKKIMVVRLQQQLIQLLTEKVDFWLIVLVYSHKIQGGQ